MAYFDMFQVIEMLQNLASLTAPLLVMKVGPCGVSQVKEYKSVLL